ncbi:unnamed protein product [Bursaphelenchus xylophilus]|uniref:(pine wood nematode) hypothetical protein n=1 Tax=Bursaphelenchus xylophilus TaxID=6326 RepID=A0A7I8XN90_BURXY|nr:unnamed protein product [Bursaphelenchus xylophilus]CAG9089466.1 unnamed protein product [Bursaphelenchus xylophilus]
MFLTALIAFTLAAGTLAAGPNKPLRLPPQYIPEVLVRDRVLDGDGVKVFSDFWFKSISDKHRAPIANLTHCVFSQLGGSFVDLINSRHGASSAGFARFLNQGIDRCVRNTTDTAVIAASNVWLRYMKIVVQYEQEKLANRSKRDIGEDGSENSYLERVSYSDRMPSQLAFCKGIDHWPRPCRKMPSKSGLDLNELLDVLGAWTFIIDELFPGLGCQLDLEARLNPKLTEHHRPNDNYELISGCDDKDLKLAGGILKKLMQKSSKN